MRAPISCFEEKGVRAMRNANTAAKRAMLVASGCQHRFKAMISALSTKTDRCQGFGKSRICTNHERKDRQVDQLLIIRLCVIAGPGKDVLQNRRFCCRFRTRRRHCVHGMSIASM